MITAQTLLPSTLLLRRILRPVQPLFGPAPHPPPLFVFHSHRICYSCDLLLDRVEEPLDSPSDGRRECERRLCVTGDGTALLMRLHRSPAGIPDGQREGEKEPILAPFHARRMKYVLPYIGATDG